MTQGSARSWMSIRHFFVSFRAAAAKNPGFSPVSERMGEHPCTARFRRDSGFCPAMFLQRPILQMPAGVARVPRGRDAFVLAICQPRVAREVPQVGEVSPEAALAAQDFVDGARATIDAAAFVNRV